MATQKITMGRGRDTDYQSKKAAAVAQADYENGFMWGQQTVLNAASVDPKYGNPNSLPLSGTPQYDNNNNQVLTNAKEQTGLLGEFSSTMNPQQSPEMMGQVAEERIQNLANGRQFAGYNNRQQIYGA